MAAVAQTEAETAPAEADTIDLRRSLEDSGVAGVLAELDRELIGLKPVKKRIRETAALLLVDKARRELGLQQDTPTLHMSFTGNPGTGKTTVALRMADLLHRLGYIRQGHLVTVTRDDLVGQYIGHTAPKTKEVLRKAMGGVLFIDEAYYLYRPENERDYGQESIEILLQVMENQRDDLVVIVAGYAERMETFFSSNPGFRSRIAHHIDFPDYEDEELVEIAEKMLEGQNYRLSPGARGSALGVHPAPARAAALRQRPIDPQRARPRPPPAGEPAVRAGRAGPRRGPLHHRGGGHPGEPRVRRRAARRGGATVTDRTRSSSPPRSSRPTSPGSARRSAPSTRPAPTGSTSTSWTAISCPNITIGPDVVRGAAPAHDKLFDVHLMIAPADPYLEAFAEAGADLISVHAEAGPHLHRSLQAIRALGKKAGVVAQSRHARERGRARCSTSSTSCWCMTVNPGFGGQTFIPAMLRQDPARPRR